MADITKCTGQKREEKILITCPFRNRCYRFTSPGSSWQSWFTETPLQRDPDGTYSCEHLYAIDPKVRP